MKNKAVKIYYLAIVLLLTVKVGTTIFTNGLAVHHGKKVAQLQLQSTNLQAQQIRLSSELSQKSSLSQVTKKFDTSNFTAIRNPIVIANSQAVASN